MTLPSYTRQEIAADAIVHGLGVLFALIGGPILIGLVATQGRPELIAAISIYVTTLIAMFTLSASYNLVPLPRAKDWLRRQVKPQVLTCISGACRALQGWRAFIPVILAPHLWQRMREARISASWARFSTRPAGRYATR